VVYPIISIFIKPKQIKAEFVFGFCSIVVWDHLLLINPIITRNTLEIIKPSLAIVVDNSSSITALDASKNFRSI
jgi:hypothetical protein